MKQTFSRRLFALAGSGVLLLGPAAPNRASAGAEQAVVGTGTPASCTEAALNTALAVGGAIGFNCGPALHTIVLTDYKRIEKPTTIDGGLRIVLSGANASSHFQVFASAALTLTNIELRDGVSTASFGSIQNFGRLTVSRARFVDNNGRATNGGAINNSGMLRVTDSLFSGNVVSDTSRGGAIASSGETMILSSVFITNSARLGGAIYLDASAVLTAGELVFRRNTAVDGGALYVGNGVTATVRRSEFSENEAMYGGAVEVSGRLLMTNTTLSRNSATQDGGGIWFVNAQEISILDNSTLFGNVAANGANLNVNGGQVRVRNSAIGRTPGFTVTNCALSLGAVFEPSNIADDASCAGATTQADLKLGPLTGNGGPTRSHLPLSGSPLIDVVLAGCPSRDQRDVERPQGPRCDVGAVEAFVGRMYLPAALNNAAGSLVEIEPNNTALQATGPLALGAPYTGAPNDANDYYVFALPSAASVTVELTGHPGESLNQVQLQLRDAGDVQIDFAFAPPFRLTRSLPAGTYYVRVFHAPPGAFPNTPAYTVKVSSP